MIRPRRWLFPLLVAVALLVAALAQLPLRLVLPEGLAASDVTGRVWNGRLVAAQVRGATLGDLAVGLRFWPLLAGRVAVDITGDVSGTLLRGGETGGENLSGRVRLAGPLPIESIDLDGVTAVFADGQCRRAAGRVQALAPGGVMAGDVRCDGGALRLALQSPNATIDLRISGDGRYSGSAVMGASPPLPLEGRL